MSKRILPLILALALVGVFLWMVLSSPSGFNFIPYLIHEHFSPGGEGEADFILVFDLFFGIVFFFILYKLFKRLFK